MTASDQTQDAALLLGYDGERLSSADLTLPDGQKTKVIVSAWDTLDLDQASLGSDWTSYAALYLFAENISLAEPLKLNGGALGLHRIIADAAAIEASGGPGTPGQPDPTGSNPKKETRLQQGGNGQPGGVLSLYLENPDPVSPPPVIDASGGPGGPGGAGDEERVGGNGGDGGAGGQVTVLAAHPAMRWLDALRAAYRQTTPAAQAAALVAVGELLPDQAPFDTAQQALTSLAGATDPDAIQAAFLTAADTLQDALADWRDDLVATTNVQGGVYGSHGDGMRGVDSNGPYGSVNGQPGAPGATEIQFVPLADPACKTAAMFLAHPSQCRMMLEKAKLQYLFLPTATDDGAQAAVAALAATLNRLIDRTAVFAGLKTDDPLAAFYIAHKGDIAAVGALSSLAAVHDEATTLLRNLQLGLDVFGMPANRVPLTSLSFLVEKGMDPIFESFSDIETIYQTQLENLNGTVDIKAQVKAARDQVKQAQDAEVLDIPQLQARLATAARTIDGWQVLLPARLARLNTALRAFASKLKSYFNFDVTTLLSALGQVAFAPDSKAMWLTQGAQLINGSISTVTNVNGVTLQKDYLLHELTNIEANVDSLCEGFQPSADGTIALSDPGGAKLLADADQINDLVDQLSGKIPAEAQELAAALKDYVDGVMARNSQVLAYNAAVALLAQAGQDIDDLKQRTADLNDEALAALEADSPDLTAFTAQAYYATRKQVMRYISMIARAYRFWALDDQDLLREGLGSATPPGVNQTLLSTVKMNVWLAYTNAIGRLNPHAFPADPSSSDGEILTISGPQLDMFKTTNLLMFAIPAVTAATPEGSPFFNMSDVRVTEVRVRLPGVKVSARGDGQPGRVEMTITQHGQETIVDASGERFQFCHEPCSAPWSYEPGTGATYQRANFQVELPDDLVGGGDRALIGPFANWTISLDNPDEVDLSGVDQIKIGFLGNSGTPFN